jgi:hypothetical protein
VDEIQKRAVAAKCQVGILWQVHIAQEETKHAPLPLTPTYVLVA